MLNAAKSDNMPLFSLRIGLRGHLLAAGHEAVEVEKAIEWLLRVGPN